MIIKLTGFDESTDDSIFLNTWPGVPGKSIETQGDVPVLDQELDVCQLRLIRD